MLHKIKTVLFDGTTATDDDARQWTMQVRNLNLERILSGIMDEFDTDEWIRIGRLEIELGSIDLSSSAWIDDLIEKIRAQLNKQLNRQLDHESLAEEEYFHNSGDFLERELSRKEVLSHEDYQLEVLIAYLKTGILPWHCEKELSLENMVAYWITQRPKKLVDCITPYLKKTRAKERFLAIVDAESLWKLIEIFFSEEELQKVRHAIEQEKHTGSTETSKHVLVLLGYYFLSDMAENADSTRHFQSFISRVEEIIRLSKRDDSKLSKEEHSKLLKEDNAVPAKIGDDIVRKEDAVYNPPLAYNAEFMNRSLGELKNYRDKERLHGGTFLHDAIQQMEIKEVEEEEEEDEETMEVKREGIFVENAGLVLINAGFLVKCFQEFGWIKENTFISDESQLRAISWLHWLATGEEHPAGYRLSLIKFLCGVDPTDIVTLQFALTEKEKQKGDELLSDIIEHWKALKNISTQSLQQSFLQRAGRLVEADQVWQLHVESRAYDILIEHLPWSFSITKLPWMSKPLFTQWLTRI